MLKRFNYNSPVILTMTLISFAILMIQGYTNINTLKLFAVYRSSLLDVLFYIRLLGHVLGHANWEHFINNFLIILILGPMLEEKYGSKKLLLMMAVTALVTGLLNILLFKGSVLLGASGIVFMLILLSSFVNMQKGTIPITLILVMIIYMGRELANGILQEDNISQTAHLLGGICGCIFGFKWRK
jgi:membrane associated rhomboid family serine protease